jgi:uncharacterized LabA/DUF88 family protein
MNTEKVYAFIDSQNLNLGVRSARWELDFKKFFIYLKDKYKITKAYLFIGHVIGNEKLYTFLQEAGYDVIFKPTLEYTVKGEKSTKGNVDAELVMHTMIQFPNFDKAIIVSGDGDFYCLIEYLKNQNKLLKIIVPSYKFSSLLRKFAEYTTSIQLVKKKVAFRRWVKKEKRDIPSGQDPAVVLS